MLHHSVIQRRSDIEKIAVIGLDGVPHSLLSKFFKDGVMPCLSRIAERGAFVKTRTSLPPVSSVAWTSFMTGANPGEHGIFGFTDLKPGSLKLHLPSFDDIKAPVIWNLIPERYTVIVNLPFTYPARPLNGILIAGFVAPIFERAVFPVALLPRLKSENYRIDVDTVRGRTDRRFLIDDLFDVMNVREKVVLDLMDKEPWELFIAVVTGTDRINHFFYDAADDPTNPYHREFIDYYKRVDLFISRFAQRIGSATRLILLSDHGFSKLTSHVQLNYFLKSMGYLTYITGNPKNLEEIDPKSKAFAMEPSRIYLNTRDRFEKGILSRSDADELRLRLRNDLLRVRLCDLGVVGNKNEGLPEEKLFVEALLKEEVYSGGQLAKAPDLVVIPRKGYDPRAVINPSSPLNMDIFSGMHTHDDAFLIVNDPDIISPEVEKDPCVSNVGKLVTNLLV
jgi:predicted AlkP superfamily phosphohydrolase/phosphomutase